MSGSVYQKQVKFKFVGCDHRPFLKMRTDIAREFGMITSAMDFLTGAIDDEKFPIFLHLNLFESGVVFTIESDASNASEVERMSEIISSRLKGVQ